MSFFQFIGTLEIGLIYALVGLAAYVSFRTLNFPDMTVDGSYVLGASVYATSISLFKFSPLLSTFLSIFAGMIAGSLTAFLSTRLKMLNLLAGIVTMTALYSINLRIMGRPNVALLNEPTLFDMCPFHIPKVIILFLIIAIVFAFLCWFLKTEIGLALRSTGNNQRMSRAQGVNDKNMIVLGLAISNGLVAFAGAIYAQYSGFSDINLGIGTVVTGLAALIIGEAIFRHRRVQDALIACILGSIIFYTVTAFALNFGDIGLQTSDQKLLTAIFMALSMKLNTIKSFFKSKDNEVASI
ncbi:MAG: ABC transporter permease [Proteobacteria bacterium]|nr:ABC transporter permease [Pseudomonadota bacterium]